MVEPVGEMGEDTAFMVLRTEEEAAAVMSGDGRGAESPRMRGEPETLDPVMEGRVETGVLASVPLEIVDGVETVPPLGMLSSRGRFCVESG